MSEEIQQTKLSKERTPAQIEALQRARVKAAEVRAKNKELRDKQKEIHRAALEKTRRENSERIQREYEALQREGASTDASVPDHWIPRRRFPDFRSTHAWSDRSK